jgi:hypothetical protein
MKQFCIDTTAPCLHRVVEGLDGSEKMEDYDRLAKLCEKLAKDVTERDALIKEKDAALRESLSCLKDMASGVSGWAWEGVLGDAHEVLSKTLPSKALDRALAAEREKCMQNPPVVFDSVEALSHRLGNSCPLERTHVATERWWLAERNSPAIYLGNEGMLTTDVWLAKKFPSFDSAQEFINSSMSCFGTSWQVLEHVFYV